MRSSGERTHVYISIYRDSASVESTRGGSLTLAPIICSKRQQGHHYIIESTHVQQLSDNQQRRLEAETTH